LTDYFVSNFTLINNFNWTLSDIENMVCWERDIYLKLVLDYQEKKKQQQMQRTNAGDFFNL